MNEFISIATSQEHALGTKDYLHKPAALLEQYIHC